MENKINRVQCSMVGEVSSFLEKTDAGSHIWEGGRRGFPVNDAAVHDLFKWMLLGIFYEIDFFCICHYRSVFHFFLKVEFQSQIYQHHCVTLLARSFVWQSVFWAKQAVSFTPGNINGTPLMVCWGAKWECVCGCVFVRTSACLCCVFVTVIVSYRCWKRETTQIKKLMLETIMLQIYRITRRNRLLPTLTRSQ